MDAQLGLFPEEPTPPETAFVGPAEVPHRLARTADRLPRSLRMGTSSWSFPGWRGIVYDRPASQKVLARHGLAAYAAHPLLRTVGIDRTYYRPISADDFRAYADSVPADFRFLVKADRLTTSPTDPEGYGIRKPNPRFLDARYVSQAVVEPMIRGLGDKAGPLLFQFSPLPPGVVGGTDAFLDRLRAFLGALPKGVLYAVELRTPAFLTDAYVQLLEDTGATHCYNVHPAMAPLDRQLGRIAPFRQPALVVRWMLHAGLKYEEARERYDPFDRLVDEDRASRERIAVAVLDALVAERPAFVVANNKAEGSAPLSVFRLAQRLVRWDAPDDEDVGHAAARDGGSPPDVA
ncbi:MAG: DUF72 domain-containing protein [Longimicrobiales bacterium]|nr:DUF72 domain-containing protein [Longimicrobiales bacterium]